MYIHLSYLFMATSFEVIEGGGIQQGTEKMQSNALTSVTGPPTIHHQGERMQHLIHTARLPVTAYIQQFLASCLALLLSKPVI